MSPIPLYNILKTDQGVLNRAKARVIKKLANKFSKDVLLQDVDITEGNANDIAEKLILELQNVFTLLQQVGLLSNIKGIVPKPRGRPPRVPRATQPPSAFEVVYPNTNSFDTFISALVNLNTKMQSAFDKLKSISASLNYVSASNIREINSTLEKIDSYFNGVFEDVNKLVFKIGNVVLEQDKQSTLINIVKNISELLNQSNEFIDRAIKSYNDKTTKANVQRMVAVDAEPRMTLRGGRRAYSVQESNLATMLI